MFQPSWLQLIFQFLKNKFLQKSSAINWDATNNSFQIIKGGPFTTLPTYTSSQCFWAAGDETATGVPNISLFRQNAGPQFIGMAYGGVSTVSSSLTFYKSNGSFANPTASLNGDRTGRYAAYAYDGANFINSATLLTVVDSSVSSGIAPQAFSFLTGANATVAERLRITSAGNIGISTSTPGAKLQINGGVVITSTPTAASDPGAGNLSLSGNVTAGGWQASRIANQYLANSYSDVYLVEDFFTTASTSTILTALGLQGKTNGVGAAIANGTATASGYYSGVWSFATGTISGNYSMVYALNTALFTTSNTKIQNLVFRLRTATLPTTAEDYNCWFGYGNNSTGSEPTDGAYFFLSSANANYQLVTQFNGTRTYADSGIAANTSNNIFRIALNSTGTQATFYINDVFINSMTITAGRTTGITQTIVKTAGSTSAGVLLDRIVYYT